MFDAFYEPDGDHYLATELTRGPWDPGAQHAGPPSALLAREIEKLSDSERFQVGRIAFDILRPVPIGPVQVSARVLRPGRRVQLVEAELSDGEQVLMRATAWRLEITDLDLPPGSVVETPTPLAPQQGRDSDFFPTDQEHGYHSAVEITFAAGRFMELGPATAWLRMRVPLVAGEDPTPLQRTLVAGDVGNGISAALDFRRYIFVNVELTIHLERMPAGEWIGVDARTLPQATGVATAESVLFDGEGRIGRAAQTLIVSERR
ncbi:MAG TPA: thioesterase family protein [Solirubrobacterales bacterium]|nr:thioesterase family protein [Solirubrobacterales bacterium]